MYLQKKTIILCKKIGTDTKAHFCCTRAGSLPWKIIGAHQIKTSRLTGRRCLKPKMDHLIDLGSPQTAGVNNDLGQKPMNPYLSVSKSSSLVLSALSIVTIRGKGKLCQRRNIAASRATDRGARNSDLSADWTLRGVGRTRRKPLVSAAKCSSHHPQTSQFSIFFLPVLQYWTAGPSAFATTETLPRRLHSPAMHSPGCAAFANFTQSILTVVRRPRVFDSLPLACMAHRQWM